MRHLLPNRQTNVNDEFAYLALASFCHTGKIPQMDDMPPNRLRELRDARDMTIEDVAEATGLSVSYVSRLEKGGRNLSVKNLNLFASAFAVPPTEILQKAPDRVGVPIMGSVGAGSSIEPDFEQVPPDGFESVELPFPVPDDMIAFRVDGDSMLPKYDPGDIIIVYREQRKPIEAFYGLVAAVRTTDGRRFIKTVTRGSRPHTVNLASWNAGLIEDVQLDWIGEIFAVLPPAAIRRTVRQGGIQGQLRLRG